MTFSALDTLLSHHPLAAGEIAAAIERGEISASMGLEAAPKTLVNFLREASGKGGQARLGEQYRAQLRIATILLDLGADPWLRDYYEADAFDHAINLGNAELVRTLAKHTAAPSDLLTRKRRAEHAPAIFQATNNAPLLRTMIELGFDPHATHHSGTLLHAAENAEVVQLLLAVGLDPQAKNEHGQDVQAHWDQRNISAPTRAAMETVLHAAAPQDSQRLLQDFAHACVEVGVPAAKRRLLSAGIDPTNARHDGFSLPEMVAWHAISRGLAVTSYHNQGNPNAHRKWRKLLISVAQHCQVDKWNAKDKAQLHDVINLFEVIDYHLIDANRPKTPAYSSSASKGKNKAPPPDLTREQLREAVGLPVRVGAPSLEAEQVGRWTQLMERAVAIQALDNGSLAMAWVGAHHGSWWKNGGDWQQIVDGEPVLVRLTKQITRGEFDRAWKGSKSLATRSITPTVSLLKLPTQMPQDFANYPGALGSVALVLAQAKDKSSTLSWMRDQLQSLPALESDDPWLAAGVRAMQACNDEGVAEVGRQMGAAFEQQQLRDTTPDAGQKRRGPRL